MKRAAQYPPQGRPEILPDPLPVNAPRGQVLIAHDGGIRGLTAGPISQMLASDGPSHPPVWRSRGEL